MSEPQPLLLMHDYQCPECAFIWRQQVYMAREFCIQCGYWPVDCQGSTLRALEAIP